MSQLAKRRPAGVVEAEPVGADVAGDDLRPGGRPSRRRARRAAELVAQAVEAVVLEDLPLGPLVDGALAAGADEQHELAVRARRAAAVRRARCREAGAAGDGDALAGERLGDHGADH